MKDEEWAGRKRKDEKDVGSSTTNDPNLLHLCFAQLSVETTVPQSIHMDGAERMLLCSTPLFCRMETLGIRRVGHTRL